MNQKNTKTQEQIESEESESEKFIIEMEKSFASLSKEEKNKLLDDTMKLWDDALIASKIKK